MRIIDILEEFVKEIEKENPYDLVLKGGTALALFYLNKHRESEDLDFDTKDSNLKKYKEIEKYFVDVLKKLKKKEVIKDFKIKKSGLALTDRYHMKLELETYKKLYTKIDIDFVKLPEDLEKKGELYLYTKERIFVGKMLTFVDRKEFKDLYDFYYLLDKIEVDKFRKDKNVVELVDKVINVIEEEDIFGMYKKAFRNADLRFKNLKQSELENFILKLVRKLKIFRNKIFKKSFDGISKPLKKVAKEMGLTKKDLVKP